MPLTDAVIKQAKPDAKSRKIADGDGLYILIRPNGAKWWRFDYKYVGKRNTLIGSDNRQNPCAQDVRRVCHE